MTADYFANLTPAALKRIAATLPQADEVVRDWARLNAGLDLDDPADRLLVATKAEALGGDVAGNISMLECLIRRPAAATAPSLPRSRPRRGTPPAWPTRPTSSPTSSSRYIRAASPAKIASPRSCTSPDQSRP